MSRFSYFVIPNGKRVEVEDKKVKEIVTTRLSPIFYWQYLKSISEEDVSRFQRLSSNAG